MDATTIAILAIVVALVWALFKSRSAKPQPRLVVALKPAAEASVMAPRGSATLLEDSVDPKSGGGSAAAMFASPSGAYDIA